MMKINFTCLFLIFKNLAARKFLNTYVIHIIFVSFILEYNRL